jgi:hypothetical protein
VIARIAMFLSPEVGEPDFAPLRANPARVRGKIWATQTYGPAPGALAAPERKFTE